MIGFSLSSDRGLDELRRQIRTLRSDSRNNRIIVILGGPFTVAHPEVVAAMGADLACDDPVAGPILARRLVRQIQAQV